MNLYVVYGAEYVRHVICQGKVTLIMKVKIIFSSIGVYQYLKADPFTGFIRDNTQEFFKKRRKVVDRQHLEVIRLEKRLTKLTQLLGDLAAQESATSSLLWPVNGIRNQRKLLEQSVVPWEDDASTLYCPFCKQTFTNFSLRKHHCRLCGRIVCGDPRTGCSTEVGLNVSTTNTAGEKASNNMSLDVRICKECHITVFSKKDFAAELTTKPPDLRSYEVCCSI